MLYFGVVLGFGMRKIIFFILLASSVFAAEWAVVASSSFKPNSLTQKQIKDIFLKKKSYIDSQEVFPVNLSANEKGRMSFEDKILSMDRAELGGYWVSQHYQGITPPITQKSQAGVKAFLKSVKGAIGYVEKIHLEADMKVLYEF